MSITIRDVNDNTPSFASDSIEIAVKENVAPRSIIYGLRAEDGDSGSNGQVQYSIQVSSSFFEVDSGSGDIRVRRALDYESQKLHTFLVRASDGGTPSKSSSVQINIVVQDVNDNPPIFTQNTYSVDIDEGTPISTKFLQVTATDMDTGNNGLLRYSLQEGAYSHIFGIYANDGYIYNRLNLDREHREQYTLNALVADSGIPAKTSTAQVVINILDANDNTPTFQEDSYNFYISENLPAGTQVGYVHATDSDQRDNTQLRYSVVGSSSAFRLDSRSGELKTKQGLDREKKEEHSFSVRVTDDGSPPRTATVNVKVTVLDVNDNAPVFDRQGIYIAKIDENQPKGTLVTQVSARDLDSGENSTITYSFGKCKNLQCIGKK